MMEFMPARRDMAGRMAEIERASFPDPWSEKLFESEFDTPFARVLAAVEDGRMVGFCILRLVFGEGEIFNIAVDPAHRGRGAGEGMLLAALKSAGAERTECVFLEVRESNAPARALYRKVGFTETGRRRGYYLTPKEDAILMTYRFPEAEKC